MNKKVLIIVTFICSFQYFQAQELPVNYLENPENIDTNKPRNFFQKIGHFLNDIDTLYISPNQYKFAFMLENSNWYEYYRLSDTQDIPQTLFISPKMNYKIGGYFGWKWIFVGYSIDVKNLFNKNTKNNRRTEFGLSLYSSVVGCDLYYRKSGSAFKLRNIEDFIPEDYTDPIKKDIDGFSVNIKGVNAYFILNHKKFSYPAAYSQSTNQRRNAGSIIAGLSYSEHNLNFDKYKLPDYIYLLLDDAFNFKKINYKDFSLSVGYSYNWVFMKNCLANLSLTPAIAYKHAEIDSKTMDYPVLNNFNFDLITRAGITYNNSKYFIGTSLVMHTYNYRSDYFNLNNSFGTIRIYAGFNFIKRKEYRTKD